MSKSRLSLSVVLEAVDRLTKPHRKAMQNVAKNSKAIKAAQRATDRLGKSDAFARMNKSVGRVNRALTDQAYRLRVIDRMQKKLEKNEQRREKLKGKVVGAAAAAAIAFAPVATSANVEDAEIRLRTVINAEDVDAGMSAARTAARNLAREGFVGLNQAFDIQYALNSAGLQADVSSAAASVVAKVAKITAGTPEQVGEIIAGTYNNLADEMTGTTDEKLNRIGELLTKTQFKFQIRNFDQLGQGLSMAAAAAASARIPIEQVVTTLGVLNSSQVTGSRAGTAFTAVERNLTKASEEFGFQIQRNAEGQMDFIGTLEALEQSLSIYDDLDERNQAIQKTFGDEGRVGLVPLLAKLKELRAAQADVVEGSQGIIEKNAKLFKEGGTGPWNQLTASVIQLADSVGKSLLPTVNAVIVPVANVVAKVADLAEANPDATAAIAGTIAVLAGLRIGMIAARIAGLALSSGLLTSKIGILKYGAGLLGLSSTAVPAVIAGIKAMGIALATTPIGLAVTALAVGAALVIANWEKVSAFMQRIWEPVKPYWDKFAGWVSKIWDKISAPFSAVSKFVFGEGDQPSVVKRAAAVAKPAATAVVTAGSLATSPAAAQPATAPVNQSINIQITPQPGQSAEEIAESVVRIIERERKAAAHD